MFVLFALQSVFVALRTSMPEVAALHPVNGFLLLFIAISTARQAWAARTVPSAPASVDGAVQGEPAA
jgi:hypothetical protein